MTPALRKRRINRRKFSEQQLADQLGQAGSLSQRIYTGYRRLLELRRAQAAFHPGASQTAVDTQMPAVVSFLRKNSQAAQSVLVVANVSDQDVTLDVSPWLDASSVYDLITDERFENVASVCLMAGQARWLSW